MTQTCPSCNYPNNTNGSVYCVRCGQPLTASTPSSNLSYQASQKLVPPTPVQMGNTSGTAEASGLRHAFAGYGTLFDHYSWLLPGDHGQAEAMRREVMSLLGQRTPSRVELNTTKLSEHGFWFEEREYIRQRRGVTTVFVYIAPAGMDLYMSRVITVLPSFDIVRIALLTVMLIDLFFGPSIVFASIQAGTGASAGLGLIFVGIIALLFPVSLIVLVVLLYASIKSWLVEKDPWMYLRRNYLNDFELDDIMVLEHITDQTVHTAAEQLHLDATKIVAPPMGYQQQKRRVRLI